MPDKKDRLNCTEKNIVRKKAIKNYRKKERTPVFCRGRMCKEYIPIENETKALGAVGGVPVEEAGEEVEDCPELAAGPGAGLWARRGRPSPPQLVTWGVGGREGGGGWETDCGLRTTGGAQRHKYWLEAPGGKNNRTNTPQLFAM